MRRPSDYQQSRPSIGPATGPFPLEDLEAVRQAEIQLAAQDRAYASAILHRGHEATVDVCGRITNPTAAADIVSFTVPQGQVAMIYQVAVWYSDPLVPRCNVVGWRLTVNNNPLPHVVNNTDGDLFYSSGDITRPMELHPVWVQSGQKVAIRCYPEAGFDWALRIQARMIGRLYNPSGHN